MSLPSRLWSAEPFRSAARVVAVVAGSETPDRALGLQARRPLLDVVKGLGKGPVVDLLLVLICWSQGFANQTPGWNRPFVLSVLALSALPVRRKFPLPAFLLGAPALGWAQSELAPAVLAYNLAYHLRARTSRGTVVVTALILAVGVNAWPMIDLDSGMWRANVSALLQLIALLGGAAALGAYRTARAEADQQLCKLRTARSRETQLVDAAARTQERTRLAREMHDVVSHQVSLIAIQAGALRVGNHPPQVQAAAEQIRGLAVQTTDELRQMLTALRSDGRQPLQAPGRLDDLSRLWADIGVEGTLEIDRDLLDEVNDGLQRTIFRITQEGLANARRHAAGARVQVRIQRNARRILVLVCNDAPPHAHRLVHHGGHKLGECDIEECYRDTDVETKESFQPREDATAEGRGTGHGLVGVEERVAAARGTLSVGGTPDGGFRLHAELPLPNTGPLWEPTPLTLDGEDPPEGGGGTGRPGVILGR